MVAPRSRPAAQPVESIHDTTERDTIRLGVWFSDHVLASLR